MFIDQLMLVKYLRRASHVSRRPTTMAHGDRFHAYARWQEPIHCAAGRAQLRVRASGLPGVRHVASAIIAGNTSAHSHVRGAAFTHEAHVNISRKAVVAASWGTETLLPPRTCRTGDAREQCSRAKDMINVGLTCPRTCQAGVCSHRRLSPPGAAWPDGGTPLDRCGF
jgi:hypothetical protein